MVCLPDKLGSEGSPSVSILPRVKIKFDRRADDSPVCSGETVPQNVSEWQRDLAASARA